MPEIQSYKLFFRFAILVALSVCLWMSSGVSVKTQQAQAQRDRKSIPVEIIQLDRIGGVIPVELRCADAELSAPNALETLSCVIRNNTTRDITAGTLFTTVIVESKGNTHAISGYDTFDTFVHPDFREEHKTNMIPPGGEYRLNDLPVSYDPDVVITGVTTSCDFIEFADRTTLGANHRGSRLLADIREGARKYKNWLMQKYEQSGKSIDAIIPLLDNSEPASQEQGIQNDGERSGANMYRNFARRIYRSKGADALARHFRQKG